MLAISAAGSAGAAALATFLGRGVEIRRTRGALSASGLVEISGEDTVSSLMLLDGRKPANGVGVENIQAPQPSKIARENAARQRLGNALPKPVTKKPAGWRAFHELAGGAGPPRLVRNS